MVAFVSSLPAEPSTGGGAQYSQSPITAEDWAVMLLPISAYERKAAHFHNESRVPLVLAVHF